MWGPFSSNGEPQRSHGQRQRNQKHISGIKWMDAKEFANHCILGFFLCSAQHSNCFKIVVMMLSCCLRSSGPSKLPWHKRKPFKLLLKIYFYRKVLLKKQIYCLPSLYPSFSILIEPVFSIHFVALSWLYVMYLCFYCFYLDCVSYFILFP